MKKPIDVPYTDDDISLFISRFTTGHWAMQGDLNIEKCTTQYIPPNESCHLTPKLVKQHLDTEITLASYTITKENTCRFLVIDFDIDTIVAKMSIGSPGSAAARKAREEALSQIQAEVLDSIEKMGDILKISRDQIILEKSGVKGYHIWIFFEDDVPARDAYRLTRILSDELGLAGYEIYPMQPAADENRPGSLIKLPLGVNRKNMERCLFLGDNFEAVAEGQWEALRNVVPISQAQLTNMMKLKDTEADRIEDDSIDDVSQIGGSIDKMINSCVALQAIRDRACNANPDDGNINLSHDERLCILSLFKKFGVVGKARIHEFLQNTDNYDPDKTNKHIDDSSIKPMKCETMQQRAICPKMCEAIAACGGKSPIKLAMGNRGGRDGVYVLNSLSEIENPIMCNKNIRVDFTVCSLADSPYYSTKKITFGPCSPTCPDYKTKCECDDRDDTKTVQLSDADRVHIQVHGADDKKALSYIKNKVFGCTKPEKLSQKGKAERHVVQPFTLSNIVYSVNQASMEETLKEEEMGMSIKDMANKAAKEMKDYLGFYLGNSLETSKTYRGYGTVMPNPHNQSITLLLNKVEPLNSHIDGFEINDINRADFDKFRSMNMKEIIDDIRNNIVYIYGRDDVILTVLLTHFSALEFSFNNTPVSKGWVESILIGDTGQAKSLLTERLLNYIGLGKVGGANMSYAGLVGGVERLQNKSFINWGLIPRCNKGLIFLDEIQNISFDIMGNLRTIRQQGFAEVNKIVKGRHEAKVRLICAANPVPENKTMSEFKYGAMSLMSLKNLGAADIRRFDIACFINSSDTRKEDVNRFNEAGNPIITRKMVQTAILWMWSRKAHQIRISEEVTKKVLEAAVYIGEKFDVATNSVPICNKSDVRESIIRLVVAHAGINCRTSDYIHLDPIPEDVDAVVKILDSIYSHKSVMLDKMVAEKKRECTLDDAQYRELKEYMGKPEYSKMRKVLAGLIDMHEIRPSDLGGWAQASGEEMSKIMTVLNKYQLIAMARFGCYAPTPKLSKFYSMIMEEENGGEGDDNIF